MVHVPGGLGVRLLGELASHSRALPGSSCSVLGVIVRPEFSSASVLSVAQTPRNPQPYLVGFMQEGMLSSVILFFVFF